jgi:hypothetical protein
MQSLNSVQAFTEGVPDVKATKARQVKKERSKSRTLVASP